MAISPQGSVGGAFDLPGFGVLDRDSVVVIQMREQADLSQERKLPRGDDRRAAAWADMERTARHTQRPVQEKLERLKRDGLVDSWESVPLGNAIVVHVPRNKRDDLREELDEHSSIVGGIYDDYSPNVLGAVGNQLTDGLTKLAYLRQGADGRDGGKHLDRAGVRDAWAQGVRGAGVTVGIIDSGTRTDHPALRDAYRGSDGDHSYAWADFTGDKRTPVDGYGHGTHTAGTAVGSAKGAEIGVAPDAELMVARGVDHQNPPGAPILEAMQWMLAPTDTSGRNRDARKGADVVSASVYTKAAELRPVFDTAVRQLADAGVVTVISAGNSGADGEMKAPASAREAITVASVDHAGRPSSFTTGGEGTPRGSSDRVGMPDVAAVGEGVVSSVDEGYQSSDGTSMATPAVAGAVALILSEYPTLTPEQVRRVLVESARDSGRRGFDRLTGAGEIDVPKALEVAGRLVR